MRSGKAKMRLSPSPGAARGFNALGMQEQGDRIVVADRLKSIAPFRVMELMKRAAQLEAQGCRVVHFEVGEPDFNTAEPIVEAGRRALLEGHTKYTHALGTEALREAVSRDYRERLGVAVPAERIVVTAGASGGLLLLSALLLNPGDGLLVTDPGYPCNAAFARIVGGAAQPVALRAAAGYLPQVDDIAAAWRPNTAGLLLASPANPTGAVMDRARLAEVAGFVHRAGGFLILDEIYQGLTYGPPPTADTGLRGNDGLMALNSFSKYFGMTGWRLGWVVVPEALVAPIERLAQNLFISPSSVAQQAALAAFSPEAMAIHEARRRHFDARRRQLLGGLEALGLRAAAAAEGAFYLYMDVSSSGLDSQEFCWRLINEFQVAATPGIDFGEREAHRFVRFAYTTDDESIGLGLERIGKALEAWGGLGGEA